MMLIVLFIIVLLAYIWFWWPRRYLWYHSSSLPGPKCLPLIGNAAMMSSDNVENFQNSITYCKMYGPVHRFWMGPILFIVLSDPEVIGKVLSNTRVQDHDAINTKAFQLSNKNGSFGIAGETWRIHRRLIMPAFNRNILRSYVELFAMKAKSLEETFYEMADGKSIDIYDHFGLFSLKSIKETVVGVEASSQKSVDYTVLMRLGDLHVKRCMQPWLLIDWVYSLTSEGREAAQICKTMQAFSEDIIAEKQEDYRRGIKRSGMMTSGGKKISSFLDMMIEASETQGSLLSAEELRDEVSALIAAGTETTAVTMSFLLILIAIHKDVQDHIHEELDAIFVGDNQRLVTAEDIDRMVLLERVIKETMRLFPAVPFQGRVLPEDIPIGNGQILPKDAVAMIYPHLLHRNKAYYKDPHSFTPDRWLPTSTCDKRHPYAYLPFSAGTRTCPGRQYAMIQMKTALGSVLRQLKVDTHLTMDVINKNLQFGISLGMNKDIGFVVQMSRRTPE